jgi:large subunit ribosomal protein L25
MQKHSLKAEKRKITGRKVKKLRKEGVLPANIYGKKIKSVALQVSLKDFEKVFKKTGETGLVELSVGGKKHPVLIHNIQKDPITDSYVHADFLQVDLKQKVTAQIPVELTGESPAEKTGLGTVVQYIDEIEVEALPTDLLDKIEVDLSKLEEVDQEIKVKDLNVDNKKIEVKNDPELIIVKVEPPRKEEEEPEPKKVEEEEEVEAEVPEGEEKEESPPAGGEKPESPPTGGEKPKEEPSS